MVSGVLLALCGLTVVLLRVGVGWVPVRLGPGLEGRGPGLYRSKHERWYAVAPEVIGNLHGASMKGLGLSPEAGSPFLRVARSVVY